MVNPTLKDLLELSAYREILDDACNHYIERLEKLPKMKQFTHSMPNSLFAWVTDGYPKDALNELNFDTKDNIKLINLVANNEELVEHLKDAIRVYYKDYHKTKEKIKEELGLIPRINAENYEKTLEEVFSKLDKF